MGISRRMVEIVEPHRAEIVTESIPLPEGDEVVVTAEWGAVSPGSERLVYSGKIPAGMRLDDSIAALDRDTHYPVRYGYTVVGRVAHCGPAVNGEMWLGRRVFIFAPHGSHHLVRVGELLPVPDGISTDRAPLYPNTETALTLLWDGAVRLGETVLVLGAGIVGSLVAALTLRAGAGLVVVVDPSAARRDALVAAWREPERLHVSADYDGARAVLARSGIQYRGQYEGFDCVFELTSRPEVLNTALSAAAFGGRVVVGSWYGSSEATLALGGEVHRKRVTILTSQVSTLPLDFGARMDYARRTAIAWKMLEELEVSRLARRVVPFGELPAALKTLADSGITEPWIAVDYT